MTAEIEATAAHWLERKDDEGWSPAQQVELDDWLAQSSAHRAAFWRLKAAWAQAERLGALKPVPLERPAAPSRRPLVLRLAAACALVAIFGLAANTYFKEAAPRSYSTAIGERKTLTLPDGTQIELNTDTHLRIASDNARKVWLDKGEAFFQIKHDAANPFLVLMGDHRVIDLGTKFLIRKDGVRTEVALVEGSARLESARNASAVLKPGDIAYATADKMTITKAREHAVSNALGWRHGVIIFDRTTLADAAAELNRYNTRQIVILDPAAARLTIHGRFPSNDTTAIVNAARDVFGLRVEMHGNDILISR